MKKYFQNIDSEDKAYFLGLMYADGWVTSNGYTFGIELLNHDRDILDKFKFYLMAEQPIHTRIQKINNKLKGVFQIHRSNMVDDLIQLGCVPCKSLILDFPCDIFSEELLSHFIRGYFDGDGSVSIGKDKGKLTNIRVNFTGSTTFITKLRDFLSKNKIVPANKLNFGKSSTKEFCTMEWQGKRNLIQMYKYLYTNATVYGNRKRNKFEEIICAINEKSLIETRLIAGKPEMVISSEALEKSIERSSTIPEMGVELSDSKRLALNE